MNRTEIIHGPSDSAERANRFPTAKKRKWYHGEEQQEHLFYKQQEDDPITLNHHVEVVSSLFKGKKVYFEGYTGQKMSALYMKKMVLENGGKVRFVLIFLQQRIEL
jgi:hypothetical protein